MENTNRNVFALNGITGMLIATVLLLSILGVLTFFGLKAQQAVAINIPVMPLSANTFLFVFSIDKSLFR
jgi:hypothetical protein